MVAAWIPLIVAVLAGILSRATPSWARSLIRASYTPAIAIWILSKDNVVHWERVTEGNRLIRINSKTTKTHDYDLEYVVDPRLDLFEAYEDRIDARSVTGGMWTVEGTREPRKYVYRIEDLRLPGNGFHKHPLPFRRPPERLAEQEITVRVVPRIELSEFPLLPDYPGKVELKPITESVSVVPAEGAE